VLIPRGSRLIGEFKADNMPGKRRVLVTWNRLIRPDGVAIRIASPATDALGGAGIAGAVNTHWMERFASAVLQSALTVG
jgi:type IV secretion system protein VirB10